MKISYGRRLKRRWPRSRKNRTFYVSITTDRNKVDNDVLTIREATRILENMRKALVNQRPIGREG